MDGGTDKLAAIMAKLDTAQAERAQQEEEAANPGEKKAPKTYEEFLKFMGLKEWPQSITSEGPMGLLESEGLLIGTQQEIYETLKEAAPIDLSLLETLEKRLGNLEDRLMLYADKIVTDEKRHSRKEENLFHSPPKAFLTQMADSDAVKTHHSRRGVEDKNNITVDQLNIQLYQQGLVKDFDVLDAHKKGVEYCVFPGFRKGELTELPAQLETPQLLHRVTKAQDFNPGFRKLWKKVFLSEASVALMQDTFWWFFLQKYQPNKKQKDQDQFFDRISDSFVALFASINPDIKDKFFQVYPDCLAQAIYAAFKEAFPESQKQFLDSFKQDILNLTFEWMSGVKPNPGSWKHWNLKRLEPKPPRSEDAAKAIMGGKRGAEEVRAKYNMAEFEKMVNSFGEDAQPGSRVSTAMTAPNTRGTLISRDHGGKTGVHFTISRQVQVGTPRKKIKESHQIGPGPDFERVMFNLGGRSPLLSHYLHMRQLKDLEQPGRRVRRTEIAKLPPPGPTYRHVISKSLAFSEAITKEYQRICEQTNKEIKNLERKRREMSKEIEKLKSEVGAARNTVELKIITERLFEKKEQGSSLPKNLISVSSSDSSEDDYMDEEEG